MKIICIGRNYGEHAKELNNPIPEQPVVFMKPSTAILRSGKPFYIPAFTQDLHHECELVLRICDNGRHIAPKFAMKYVDQVTVGIDFTARDVQSQLKAKGHPWEIAKAFDSSAPIGELIPYDQALNEKGSISFSLRKNGELVQQGDTADMIFSFQEIISYVSQYFKLNKGDFIYTGTPAGVGPVKIGDVLEAYIGDQKLLHTEVR
jgi:2-keto-4-pentenoate hydratase/2-oxohepta-3-ene-1,7-dioic acid hydratase in catechol pathway